MAALPARNIFDGSSAPATSTMKAALGSLRDFLADLLGTTGTAADARTALSIPALSEIAGFGTGCGLSTAGGSATMTIQPGAWLDSTNVKMLVLPSVYTKTTSSWAVGTAAGAYSRAGAIPANQHLAWYLIRRPDTGLVDVCVSPSMTGLVAADYVSGSGLVANAYTQFRRLAFWPTASSLWAAMTQDGNKFWKQVPTLDIDSTSFVSAATLYTLAMPTGVKLEAMLTSFKIQGASGLINFWSPSLGAGLTPSTTVAPLGKSYSDSATGATINSFTVLTNTSGQIYGAATAGTQTVRLVCEGWIDTRGLP
jgi:hypothetical protein